MLKRKALTPISALHYLLTTRTPLGRSRVTGEWGESPWYLLHTWEESCVVVVVVFLLVVVVVVVAFGVFFF